MNTIGFSAPVPESAAPVIPESSAPAAVPRKSVVQVRFPDGRTLAYYNDSFDLSVGDTVFVDGKLAGIRGRVAAVSYSFRIRLSDYHRVIARADTEVHGQFYSAGAHFVTFDPAVLPVEKVRGWFLPPAAQEDYACGCDDSSFPLNDLSQMGLEPGVAERGRKYYMETRVLFLSVQGTRGYAIVEGTRPYEVEFTLADSRISGITCSCYCPGTCKHEFAAMLQLCETLALLGQNYGTLLAHAESFAAIAKPVLMDCAVDSRSTAALCL